ncbi:hypothetical protein ACPA9J_35190 [Pseudomonas aeruginosa]
MNDLADQASVEYLTRFDSTPWPLSRRSEGRRRLPAINGDCVKVLRSPTPEAIDWQALRVDLVLGAPASTPTAPRPSVSSAPARRGCCSRSRWRARRTSTPPSSMGSTSRTSAAAKRWSPTPPARPIAGCRLLKLLELRRSAWNTCRSPPSTRR